MRSNEPILQKTAKINIVQHPAKLPNILELSNRDEDNLSYCVKKNTNSKNISESCINDETRKCKCIDCQINAGNGRFGHIYCRNPY